MMPSWSCVLCSLEFGSNSGLRKFCVWWQLKNDLSFFTCLHFSSQLLVLSSSNLQSVSTLIMYFMYKQLTKHNSNELIIPPIGEEKQGSHPNLQKRMKACLAIKAGCKAKPNQL